MPFSKFLNGIWNRNATNTGLQIPDVDSDSFVTELAAALPDSLKWEWDEQTGGALSIFEVNAGEPVLAALTRRLGESWDSKNKKQAPRAVKSAIKDFGGLRPGQQIFAAALTDKVVLLGLWWPWGHGATVSIRLVPYALGGSANDISTAQASVRQAFQL